MMNVAPLNYAVKTSSALFDLARPRGSFVATRPGSSGDSGRPPTGELGCGTGKVLARFGSLKHSLASLIIDICIQDDEWGLNGRQLLSFVTGFKG